MTVDIRKYPVTHDEFTIGNDLISFTVCPYDGGRLKSLKDLRTDTELLYEEKRTANIPRFYGADYDVMSARGVEEAFPTVHPCRYGRKQLPFFGEVWTLPWSIEIRENDDAVEADLRCACPYFPAEIRKTFRLESGSPVLKVAYTFTSRAENAPAVFAVHPTFIVYDGAELEFPDEDFKNFGTGKIHHWPYLGEFDLRKTGKANDGLLCDPVFTPVKDGSYKVRYPQQGTGCKVSFDTKFFHCLAAWFVYGMESKNMIMGELYTAYPAQLDTAIENGGAFKISPDKPVKTEIAYTVGL